MSDLLVISEVAKRSAEAVARLTKRIIGLPHQFADVGKASALGAWRTCAGGLDGEYALFADFEHPRGARTRSRCSSTHEPAGSSST